MMNRPKWTHEIDEGLARWIYNHRVNRITLETKWQAEDRWENYLMLHDTERKSQRRAPGNLFTSKELLRYSDDNRGIVTLTAEVAHSIEDMDRWKKANQRDLAEYKRLAKKFAGMVIEEES